MALITVLVKTSITYEVPDSWGKYDTETQHDHLINAANAGLAPLSEYVMSEEVMDFEEGAWSDTV